MTTATGQPPESLDSPQLVIDLDVVDGNLRHMLHAAWGQGVDVRIHFKSLKSAGLARYLDGQVRAEAACFPAEQSTLEHLRSAT
jgi:D-serine deaminase-like pyridoxal phosphate-dependent protein